MEVICIMLYKVILSAITSTLQSLLISSLVRDTQAVKNMGKHVEVAHFESNVSKDLLDVADNRHLLNQNFFKGLWSGKRRTKRKRVGEVVGRQTPSG